MKVLLNWFISLTIPYVLVAMFCVLTMTPDVIGTYKSVVQSNTFVAVMFLYTLIMFIITVIIANDDKADYFFIKKKTK